MKKKERKLVLNRETLRSLDLRGVAGGGASLALCGGGTGTMYCDSGSYGLCVDSQLNCSNGCTSGGACTSACPTETC